MTSERRRPDVGNFIRQQREVAQKSIRDLAKLAGVSNPYLSQIERGLRKPSAEILQQLARALQISSLTLYERAGIIDPHESSTNAVAHSIANDEKLTAEQKHALLAVYHRFIGDPKSDQAE
ncbi:MAG: helix-turn-helix transcriptional regulator [Actinomycetota bacterium]